MNKYTIVSPAQGFTPYGFNKDVVLSSHKTYEQAKKAFNKVIGRAVMFSPSGEKIDDRIT